MTQNAMSQGGSEKEEITLKTGQKALTLIVLGQGGGAAYAMSRKKGVKNSRDQGKTSEIVQYDNDIILYDFIS